MARKFTCTTQGPIVQTRAGKLRGYCLDGTYTFHGIQYATAARFQPPVPVQPWDGVRDATSYGHVAPLMTPNSPAMDLLIPHRFWPESEDCLYLNVWTQSLDPEARRPVMVWLHGGGYAAGSSIEMVAYDGDNLSKFGDVVVVTVNHRLNILGYFDLESFDARFRNSGNAGQADLVEALRWVRDNIAAFGGDPDNVTLFGQSGGGGKVLSLLQTPAADGLFHRGILMSGGAGRPMEGERHDREIAELLIAELGGDDVRVLETVPYARLVEAFHAIAPKLEQNGWRAVWAPLPNDWYLGNPHTVGYTAHAKTIPLMVGSVIAEWGFSGNVPDKDNIPVETRRALLAETFGPEQADTLIQLFRRAYPGKNELTLLTMSARDDLIAFAERHAALCAAPIYLYLFCFDFPIDGGMPAWHCSDIPFAFHNTDKVAICNTGAGSDALEAAYFGAYVRFAGTGNPNASGLPAWPAFTAENRATMYFDAISQARADADTELHALLRRLTPDPFAALSGDKTEEKLDITF